MTQGLFRPALVKHEGGGYPMVSKVLSVARSLALMTLFLGAATLLRLTIALEHLR